MADLFNISDPRHIMRLIVLIVLCVLAWHFFLRHRGELGA